MICPQTQMQCPQGCGDGVRDPCATPPTLAEIERLAVAYGNACGNFVGFGTGNSDSDLAALMAAIRAYGRK